MAGRPASQGVSVCLSVGVSDLPLGRLADPIGPICKEDHKINIWRTLRPPPPHPFYPLHKVEQEEERIRQIIYLFI